MLPSALLGSTFGMASGIFASFACDRPGLLSFSGTKEQAAIPASSKTSAMIFATEDTEITEWTENAFKIEVSCMLIVILPVLHIVFLPYKNSVISVSSVA